MSAIDRRQLIRRALGVVVATALVPPARATGSCTTHESESLRVSVNYLPVSADPSKSCAGCAFFHADAAAPGCGQCDILSGPADATGFCDSWSAREG